MLSSSTGDVKFLKALIIDNLKIYPTLIIDNPAETTILHYYKGSCRPPRVSHKQELASYTCEKQVVRREGN